MLNEYKVFYFRREGHIMVVRNQDEGWPIRMIALAVPIAAAVWSCARAVLGNGYMESGIGRQGEGEE